MGRSTWDAGTWPELASACRCEYRDLATAKVLKARHADLEDVNECMLWGGDAEDAALLLERVKGIEPSS